MDVIMPQLGETVAEGTVSIWHKEIGDAVSTKEPLFDVSSDKVEMEVPAPAEGTLLEIRVDAGTTVPVGEVVAIIVREGEVIEAKASASVAVRAKTEASKADIRAAHPLSAKTVNRDANGNPLSPAVRRLVDEHQLDPALIDGSGIKGRIKKKDVLAYVTDGEESRAPALTTLQPTPLQFSADDTKVIPFSNCIYILLLLDWKICKLTCKMN